MGDKLQGISLGEQDFVSILQNVISKGNVKKEVNIEVKGAKDIDKVNAALEKFSSINTDNVINQLEVIDNLLTKRFKGVNLNQFTAKLIQALQDPSKSAEDLSNAINDVYDNLTTLASVNNSGSFTGFNESEIRKTIKRQREILELKKQLESEGNAARAKAARQKPVDILTRSNVEKIQKKSSSDVATSLGVDSSKINVKNGDDSLLQTYQQTADLLAKMVSERKEYNKLNKANAGDYLKQEQDILSVFQQLQEIEKQISEKFGISSQNLLSNQFKGDNGQFDFVERARKAVNAYVTQMTSGTQKALQSAQNKLASQLESAATKSVDRLGQANEKVGKISERLGGSRVGSGGGAAVQPGAEIGESVAAGMKTAEVATESATDKIKEYIVSIEDSINEINRLQNIIDKGGLSDKEEDALLQKQAFHLANINRLNANKEQKELIESDALANAEDTFGLIKSGEFGKKAQEMLSQITSFTDSMQSVIDRWVSHNKKRINAETPEQFMVANDQTGFILEGENKIVGGIEGQSIRKALFDSKGQGNSIIHSHPDEQVAAFSFDDIQAAIGQKVKGIIHQYVVSLNDISFLDVSQFTDEQLSAIVEQFKQNAYFSLNGGGHYLDSTKAFETIKTDIDLYIDNILSDLHSFLGNDAGKIDFSSLKLSIQNAIKEEGIDDVEGFVIAAQETISKALDQKNITYDLNDLEYKVTNPTTSKILQSFSEGELLKAIQSVVPNIDLSSVYKRTTLEDYNSGKSLLPSKVEDVKTDIPINTNDAEEKIKSLEASIQSLREELQRFKDTGVEPEGISELQSKLESAQQNVRSLSDELSLVYEHSVSESDYSRLEDELALAKANAEDLRESLVQVKSELEQSKIETPLDSDALDKKVTELQYLHDKVRTIFDGSDGIVNEDMTYSEKFNSSEVQRMIELLNQLSDAELRATGVMPDDENSYNTFRFNLQAEVDAIKETQEMLQQAYDTGNYNGLDAGEIDVSIWDRLEHIYEIAQQVTNQFDSKLTPAVREFLQLAQGDISGGLKDVLEIQGIDKFVNSIIDGSRTAKEAFSDFENAFGYDTARFDSLIPVEVPQELKGLYDSLFSDVENRIKSAEQAAAEFNAELAKLSTSGDVSASADQSAQSDIQAAEAAEQRAQANEHLAQSELNVGTSKSAGLGNNIPGNATDATIIGATVDAEITKLNELKDKIATDIPQAIGVKNNAFRDEQSVVESVVGAEINALTKLEGGLKGVTEAAKNKTKAFQEQPKNVGGQTSASGSQKTNTKKEPTEQEKRDQEDAASLKQYNLALTEYLKLENQRIALAKKGTVELSAEQEEKRIGYLQQMNSIQEKWNETQNHSNKLQDEYNRLLNKRSSSEQSTDTYYRANYNEYAKSFTHYGQRLTTINSLLNEKELRPEAFGKAMDDLVIKGEELKKLFPLNPTDQEGLRRAKQLSDEIEQMSKEIRSNPEYKNAKETSQAALSKKAEQWAANNSAAIKANPEGFERIRKAIADINTLSDQNEASRMLDDFIAKSNAAGKAGASFADMLKSRFKSLGAYLMSFASFYRVIGWIRQTIQMITQLDTALVELKKVSDESAKSYSDFMKQSFDMANEVGTTAEQIIQSTADWKRLGRSFEESKKLAQQSTVLMNVSEFQNINDATEAMVSATQAYTDVASEDIIDKLNHVGNNFAVGTSELAQGLQNAAAVLKTQGNDIDEALALLTAGNLIGQDMSKASAGIRTISLRISGTEEAKDEIADMGEDVDDFVVRTKSKTDKIIRDYTSVASNSYKGISVLDDNGNLRDTYSILLDISKIYKEIQEEDKQYGTNRAQALVEVLAGKNRSNIASSILLNGDILEQVYNESKNDSKGSAQHELETYLDSIEGKTAKLKNQIQELISTAVDSDFLKDTIDGLTVILDLVNSLVDAFGTLPTVLGAVSGFFMQRNGWGILSQNKLTKQFEFGLANNIKNSFKNASKLTFSKELSSIFDGADGNTIINKQWVESMGGFDKLPKELQNYIIQCNQAGQSTITLGGAMNALGTQTTALSGAFQTLGSIGLNVLSTLGTMAIMTVVSMGIQAIVTGINDLIHADEIAIEKGKEAQEYISDTVASYHEQKEELVGLQEEYAKLSTGVDASSGSVKNRNLSEKEFDRYLEISSQIADISPELVTGYDKQGNAIVNLGNTVDGVNEKFQDYLNLQRDITNAEIGSNLNDVWKGLKKEAKQYQNELQTLEDTEIKYADLHSKSITAIGLHGQEQDKIDTNTVSITVDTDDRSRLHDILFDNDLWRSERETGYGTTEFSVDLSTADEKVLNTLNSYYEKNELEGNVVTNLADAQYKKAQILLDQTYQKAIPAIQEYINSNSIFDRIDDTSLADNMRTGLSEMISRIDFKSVADDIDAAGGLENWVDGLIATMSIDDTTVQQAFNELFELEKQRDNMSLSDYLQRRNELYQQLEDRFGEEYLSTEQLAIMFGNATKDENGNYHDIFADRISFAGEKVGFGGDQNFYRQFSEAPIKFAESALSAIESMPQEQADKIAGNWDAFWAYIQPYLTGQKYIESKPTDTLSDVINDESYKETAETASSHLSTLTSALETLRTEGHLTAETMVELQNAFPDLTEFTTESLNAKAFEELDAWIKTIREDMDEMSPEGKEQAQTLIRNMVDQYGDLGLDISDVRKKYVDSNKAPIHYRGQVGEGFDMMVAKLRSDLAEEGIELDTHVLYTLVAQDEFSGTAEEILEKYKDEKFFWEIILENQEFEKDITKQQALANNYQAMREAKQAKGETITSADYGDLGALDQIANDRRGEAENAWKFYVNASEEDKDAAYVAWIDAETAARQAEAEALSKYQESVEAGANDELKNLNDNNNVITDLQNDISKAELNGGKASRKMYEDLAKAQENSATINNNLADLWQGFADSERKKGKNANQALITTWEQQAAEYRAAAIQAEADARENYANPTLEEYNQLQNESNEIQRDITKAEQKNQKVSKQTYRDLLANGQKQIRNLRQQQEEVADFGEEWWNLQNDIESMQDSMFEWGQSLDRIVYDQAAALADAINTAISESASGTGLTSETINALITGFSDLSGKQFDLSDMFYNTADGVKVNTEAVRELTDAEFDLQAVQIQNEIDQVQQALDKNPGNSALQEKLQTLMQTQAQYFAQYEEMQKALSYNNAITVAEGTENAGANYDANYARVKTYKEAREKGLIGTDEFKAWTSYLDVYGRDTIDAYDAVSTKIDRYFTEDASEGLSNFLVDMEKLGYAAQDADGYWTITADDYNAAAQDMQMGSEWFMDTMRKLEDFGMIHTYVSSLTEAQLKTQDVEGQIAQAVQTYQNMLEMGASDEELQKQVDKIHELESAWSDVNYVAATWEDVTAENRAEEFLGLEDRLISLSELYAKADTKAGRDAASNAAQDYVKQFGMTLDEELAKQGVFQLSAESQIEYDSRMPDFGFSFDNLEQKMLKQGQGGNVDLLARPLVDAAKLVEAGWEDAGEGIATVYSSTFSNEDGSVAMNFTPILTDENGNFDRVLSPDELQKYAEEVIAGTSTDDLNLQIGAEFTGDYAVENAEMAAEKIHELQDVYYGEDLQNFKEYYDNNTEAAEGYLSVLAKVPRDTLEKISLSNNNYEVDHEVEDAFQGLADALGYTNENAGQLLALLDALGIDLSELEVPDAAQDGLIKLQDTLSKVEKYPGIKYNIDLEPDYSQMTPEEIQSQIDEIDLFEHNINLEDEDVLAYLEELKENANIQLDIQTKLQGGDFTLPELKRLIDAGDDEGLAAELGIDMTQEGAEDQLARYKKMLQDMPQSYDMVIHIDDSQFTDLLNTIVTGELPVVEFDSELNEEGVEEGAKETKKKIEKTPITQTIVQKVKQGAQNLKQGVQNVGSAISNIFSGGQQATTKAGMDTSGVEQGTKEIKQDVAKVNKMSGTATVQVNTDQANAKINALRNNLLLLNQLVVAPQFNESAIVRAITRTDTLIQKLQRAQQLKQSSAIGTAHARGTALSHSYAGGTQDWTVGEDESALVNEIGQESIVRDGVWQLIPGGPHVEDLKKDDIINKCDFIR